MNRLNLLKIQQTFLRFTNCLHRVLNNKNKAHNFRQQYLSYPHEKTYRNNGNFLCDYFMQ